MTIAKSTNGYTLVEMLAAMLVLGLAMTALTQTTRLFSRTSHRAAATSSEAARALAAERLLQRALGSGPYGPTTTAAEAVLAGDGKRVQFDCAQAEDCELLLLPGGDTLVARGPSGGRAKLKTPGAEFRYVVGGQSTRTYPQADDGQGLEAIAVVSADGEVLARWRAQTNQSADCAFDQVNHRCFARRAQQ